MLEGEPFAFGALAPEPPPPSVTDIEPPNTEVVASNPPPPWGQKATSIWSSMSRDPIRFIQVYTGWIHIQNSYKYTGLYRFIQDGFIYRIHINIQVYTGLYRMDSYTEFI